MDLPPRLIPERRLLFRRTTSSLNASAREEEEERARRNHSVSGRMINLSSPRARGLIGKLDFVSIEFAEIQTLRGVSAILHNLK